MKKRIAAFFILFFIPASFYARCQETITPSKYESNRRVLYFSDFEDGRTASWSCSEGSATIINDDGNKTYVVQKYDYIDFENVNHLVNFRMEFNMKYSIAKENRGKAWPALYVKSLNPTQRYEIFFEVKENEQSINLRRNGINTLSIPYDFYNHNEKWIYIRLDMLDGQLSLYINDTKTPVMSYEDTNPIPPGPLGFVRGNCEYVYIDNLLVTAAPLADGEEDTAFSGIVPVTEKSENIYGQTYIDTDFKDGLSPLFRVLGKKAEITENGAAVKGRLAIGDKSWKNYSIETDFTLRDKIPTESTEPFLKIRCKNELNYYILRVNAPGTGIQLYKYENGSMSWVGQTVFYIGDNRKIQFKIDIYEDKFILYSKSKSYPNFEYPILQISDAGPDCGGIEFTCPDCLSSIDISRLSVREIVQFGNIGSRPNPCPLSTIKQNPYETWTDTDGHWAAESLKFLGNIGAIAGYADETFRPDENISVKETIKILCRAKGINPERNDGNWAAPYIAAAEKNGWISDGDFENYDRHILRGELSNIICAALGSNSYGSFIMQGDESGELHAFEPVTRAEAAVMISRCVSEVFRPEENTSFVSFKEYPLAFANPYKGFRNTSGDPYVTLVQCTFYWNKIEEYDGDGVDKIIAEANRQFEGFPENNVKAIIGVSLEFPPQKYWPDDMTAGDYSSSQFKERMTKLVEKLAVAFDNDPRVAFVQMRLIGKWGEMQDPAPTPEVARLMSETFHNNFKNKIVLTNIVPHMVMFQEYGFGTHWDSYGHWGNIPILDLFESDYFKDMWKKYPVNGEAAYDWGEPLGRNPNDAVINYKDRYIDIIRGTHCTNLGWISRYDKSDPDTTSNAIDIQKAMGYRFVLQNAKYTSAPASGGNLSVSFTVANTGSAPIYYNEPLELSLLDPETHEVVWSAVFKNTDIRTWLPDDDYSCTPVYEVSESFSLPQNLAPGIYTLALSILDSQGGNLPSVRFANTNYYKGGRTPIGNIGIDTGSDVPELDESKFADLFTDKLHYIYTPQDAE